jgi:hypothetical protein
MRQFRIVMILGLVILGALAFAYICILQPPWNPGP